LLGGGAPETGFFPKIEETAVETASTQAKPTSVG